MKFVKPEMNISMFEVEDIVTSSNTEKTQAVMSKAAEAATAAGKQVVTFEITF